MTRRAVIVDVVRSPFGRGRPDGALAALHPVDLYAHVLKALVARTGVAPNLIEDVISGCVQQVGEQAGNVGRQVTLDRKCGSAQQAFDFAAQGIIAGAYDVVIAGGVEMMSRVPAKASRLGRDSEGEAFRVRYPQGLVSQGVSAELIADRWGISREALDQYAYDSHMRAAAAEDAGVSRQQITPIQVSSDKGSKVVTSDEGIRRDTSLGRLASLTPAFASEEARRRFPQIHWRVTAGNSSQITDGASAALLVEETVAGRLGLRPRAAVTHFALAGDDPLLMLMAIVPATRKLLRRANLQPRQVDVFEVNEAFASVVLAWIKEIDVDPQKVNQLGGAIALGHPVGASGGRLLANMLATLESRGGRYGLQTMCESGGMANATLVERL
jgi:acetyl-CoA acyltransferase